jgi:glycosyltransferase involved in cell wall biosynthesis
MGAMSATVQPNQDESTIDDVWVVVPLYNEAPVINGVVAQLRERFAHVVCVDDGSSDDSARIAEKAGARVLRHPVNLGQGAALQTGITYALSQPEFAYLVTFDADGQHRIEDVLGMLDAARKRDLAIIFGSRFLDNRTKAGWAKQIVLKTAVWVTNQTTGLRLSDAHNGLRVIRSDAARAIKLSQDRMAHATQIVLQLARTRLPWAEYPVEVLYTEYSRGKGQSLLNSVNILVDLLIR